MPSDIPAALRECLTAGGKRLRPLLCVLGWHAAGGHGDDRLGTGAAILIGDMALAWSDELLYGADHPPHRLARLRRVIDVMRQEVIYGQYLDPTTTLGPVTDHEAALRVIRFKTAKYTCERPLHCGTTLTDGGPRVRAALSQFALPLGEAFQLRDDILAVYGRPDDTGKPVLDELREGKHTVLLALAAQRADTAQRTLLDAVPCPPPVAVALRDAAARAVERIS
ncbi:hypothetical protein B7R87_03925 [Streptomyces tsukubensis]|nr:hypothetical protein B7R87_03925 [Streptomyces tsukubensis]